MKGRIIAGLVMNALMQEAGAQNSAGGQAKAPKFCKKDWDPDEMGEVVSFEFANGTKLELDCSELTDSMRTQIAATRFRY